MIEKAKRIAEIEFEEIVASTEIIRSKLRIHFIEGSFLDVYISRSIPGRFAFHWERRHVEGKIYRYDNYPNSNWRDIPSFPYHFHDASDENAVECSFDRDILPGFRDFMHFVRDKLAG